MIGFLLPKYVRDGREMLKAARKLLHYKRDVLRPEEIETLETRMGELRGALKKRDREASAAASAALEEAFSRHVPPEGGGFMRENCEVFLVAIVIAVGVRTYFLQPFTIPTGSMQPTLNGVIAHPMETPPPNPLKRVLHMALYGRSYFDAVSAGDDVIVSLRNVKRFGFFNYTEIGCERQRFLLHAPAEKLEREFGVRPGRRLAAGEIVARGYVDTGDHVFVDKVSYQFRRPERGEVFVFNTLGIPTGENVRNPGGPSQFYIKRLAGLPGDRLRIDPPSLFINGEIAKEPGMQRVMRAQDGYRGYSNGPAGGGSFRWLGAPDDETEVPPKDYFALGDNSYHSSDSRDWGFVPEKNLVGRGFFVYWPFTSHWGLIR